MFIKKKKNLYISPIAYRYKFEIVKNIKHTNNLFVQGVLKLLLKENERKKKKDPAVYCC